MRNGTKESRELASVRLDEQRLVKMVKRGDHAAGRELVEKHKQRLFAFVWRLMRNNQDAEDICQEAFLKAFSSLASYNPMYRFSTWLFTIAYRLCLNNKRRPRGFQGEFELDNLVEGNDSSASDIAESEDAGRMKDLVWRAVDRLNDSQKAVTLLFYRENYGCQEIAEIMNLPVATVKSHLFRARAKLKEMLEQAGDADCWIRFRNPDVAAG